MFSELETEAWFTDHRFEGNQLVPTRTDPYDVFFANSLRVTLLRTQMTASGGGPLTSPSLRSSRDFDYKWDAGAVPEPSTLTLGLAAVGVIAWYRRSRC